MAYATRTSDGVVLRLSNEEALYVAAELGGGNAYYHGEPGFDTQDVAAYDRGVYPSLVHALGVRRGGPLAKRYAKHQRVTAATRPEYDSEAGHRQAEREGFLVPEKV